MKISDDIFMRQAFDSQDASQVFNQKGYDKSGLIGIGNKNRWEANKIAGLVGVDNIPENDPLPSGTHVEFTAPDNITYKGRVASKSGKDYVVEVSQGESYLVPPGRLAKITPDSKQVKNAMRRQLEPEIILVSQPAIEMANRCCARVAYRARKPSDDELIRWAGAKYPDWRLVDAVDNGDREIGLIFEIEADKVAYEDTKPQGGDTFTRGTPLSSESYPGTGVEPKPYEQPYLNYNMSMEEALPEDEDKNNLNMGAIAQIDDDFAKIVSMMDHPDNDSAWVARFDDGAMIFSTEERGILVTPDGEVQELSGSLDNPYDETAQLYSGPSETMDPTTLVMFDRLVGSYSDKLAQQEPDLGESGGIDPYQDLIKAARWTLARFNDSNPNYYAIPQETDMAGEGDNHVVRLSFFLQKKDGDDLNHVYLTRSGKLDTGGGPGTSPARGFVQVDSEGNLPMVMLQTPVGPENVQEFGFDFTAGNKQADSDMCAAVASEILSEFGGYSSDAQAEFEARLVKLGVDDKTKEYWGKYFKDYGKMLTRDIPRKKHKTTDKPTKKTKKQSIKNPLDLRGYTKTAVNQNTKEAINKIASNYNGFIKEEGGQYCIKSENNPDWSGGYYNTKKEAEERLQQVEYFKHKGINTYIEDGYVPSSHELGNLISLGIILHERKAQIQSAWKGLDKRKKQEVSVGGLKGLFGGTVPVKDLTQIAQWAIQISDEDERMYEAIYSLVYDYLRKNPGFLPKMTGKKQLDDEGVGFTLLYALRESPKALNKFKKYINQYTKRYENKKWKELQEEAKTWRQQQREDKKTQQPEEEIESDELVVEPEEEDVIEVQPEEFTLLDDPQQQQTPQPPPPPQQEDWSSHPSSGTMPSGYKLEYQSRKKKDMIIRQADAGPGPISHNAPGKDDKEDYNYHERRRQYTRSCNKFDITRMYSTTSSSDNGYVYMDVAWDPSGMMEDLGPQNMKQQIISFVKGLESTKEFHDFGVMGRVRIMDFDYDAGLARVKVRCSETRGVPTLGYTDTSDEPISIDGIK